MPGHFMLFNTWCSVNASATMAIRLTSHDRIEQPLFFAIKLNAKYFQDSHGLHLTGLLEPPKCPTSSAFMYSVWNTSSPRSCTLGASCWLDTPRSDSQRFNEKVDEVALRGVFFCLPPETNSSPWFYISISPRWYASELRRCGLETLENSIRSRECYLKSFLQVSRE